MNESLNSETSYLSTGYLMSEEDWLTKAKEANINVGILVRSYDFITGNDDYVEGILINMGPAPEEVCPCGLTHLWIQGITKRESCESGVCTDGVVKRCTNCDRQTNIHQESCSAQIQSDMGVGDLRPRGYIRCSGELILDICPHCDGNGYIDLDLNGQMFYPHIGNMRDRGEYGPGFVRIVYLRGFNYPRGESF